MAITKKILADMLKQHKNAITKETQKLFKQQEQTFVNIVSSNIEIISKRLEKIETNIRINSLKINELEKEVGEMGLELY